MCLDLELTIASGSDMPQKILMTYFAHCLHARWLSIAGDAYVLSCVFIGALDKLFLKMLG